MSNFRPATQITALHVLAGLFAVLAGGSSGAMLAAAIFGWPVGWR